MPYTVTPKTNLPKSSNSDPCYYTKRDCKKGYVCVGAEPPYRMGSCKKK